MYLSRFGVKNYKCLGDIDIPLTPIHVLIGENDAGKTSVLEAIAALFASAEKPLKLVFPQPWTGRELVLHAHPRASIELSGEWNASGSAERPPAFAPFRYGFEVDLPVEGNDCKTPGDWIVFNGKHSNISPQHDTLSTALCRWKRGQERLDGRRKDLAMVSKVLRPAHKYALDPKVMAVPAAIDPSRKFRLDPDGFGLPTLLDDILGHAAETFLRLRSDFCEFFPQFRSVRVESENALARSYAPNGLHSSSGGVGKAIYFETRTGETVRAQQASDGTILFLGFLALAHLPDPPSLLLIEEPENAIYPKRLQQVISMLKQMAEGTDGVQLPQIILTTHSPYVLSFFEPDEVTFLSRSKDGPDAPVRARPLRDAPKIQEGMGSEFYLGELWYNLTEEELFGE